MIEARLTPVLEKRNSPMDDPALTLTRVLIVDDDNDTTDLLKIILEANDFEVIVANTGQQGIDLAHKLIPDVMIVDLLMPDIDGQNVCRAIRAFSSIPILILSAVSKPNVAAELLDSGADDFLIKPMSSGMLIASLNKLTRRARAEQKARSSNGNGSNS